jgi:hypothetical protein
MVITGSEICTIRIKNLSSEFFNRFRCASSSVRTCIIGKRNNSLFQHSRSSGLNGTVPFRKGIDLIEEIYCLR